MPKQITGQDIRTEPLRLGQYGKPISRGDLFVKGQRRGAESRLSMAKKAKGGAINYKIIKPILPKALKKKAKKKK